MAERVLAEEEENWATMPLYERVKLHIHLQYEQALHYMFRVNLDLARHRNPRYAPDFVASVLRLYTILAPKIGYSNTKDQDGKNLYERLLELDQYILEPHRLTLADAKRYFFIMRFMLEDLRITKIESPMLKSDEKAFKKFTE